MGVLDGIRVLELARVPPAEMPGMILADMGADVLKIETPDPERPRGPEWDRRTAFAFVNRNKRSMTLNLKAPEGQAIFRRLAASGAVESIEENALCQATRETAAASFGVAKARDDFGASGDGDGDPASFSSRDHVIAVLDTGIDGRHPELAGGKIVGWQDFVNHRPEPYDDNGHGTHCASIAAGRPSTSPKASTRPGRP